MFETIRISPCPKALLQVLGNHLMVGVLVAVTFVSLASAVWANPYANSEVVAALSTAQIIPDEAQELASKFVDSTLPKLVTDDVRVAKQLGFGDARSSTVTLEQSLPLMILFHKDVLTFAKNAKSQPDPIDLINNTNNWMKDEAGRLVPRRVIYPLKLNDGISESGAHAWSSLTLEMSPSGSWRIFQIGAPKLARAINRYAPPQERKPFLLWIPDLNRHYLGEIRDIANRRIIILTVLFNDPLASRNAGEQINIPSMEFFTKLTTLHEKLKHYYQETQLPKQSEDQNGEKHKPSTAP